METILEAAGAAVGTALFDPVDLGGSSRSTVLRCRTAAGGSVVVKAYTSETEALRCFAAEAAGLSLPLAGPRLLGVDPEFPLVVVADLGQVPTLADVLLGDDPKAAEAGLLAWADALGGLAAASVPHREELAGLHDRFGRGLPSWEAEPWFERVGARLLTLLEEAGIPAPPELAAELARLDTAVRSGHPQAFTPGDTCPDNNLLTADGLRLIDFEGAGFESVFLTAAYCRMPFSTCWCVFRLPSDLAERVEQTFRARLVPVYPQLAEDAVWQRGLRQAVAVWTVHGTVPVLPRAIEQDAPLHRTRRPVPTRRQLLLHRWELAATLTELPAFAQTMRLLLGKFTDLWQVPPLPGYPAFGGALSRAE
ncbi:hypothetical protein [Kitasatospora sp. HPMI-4]|uniref:hypothetical protein n=1 Tax=Kitasatospora sp. HPMI-4 TaxID=3448443 RepID=UPI003F198EB4